MEGHHYQGEVATRLQAEFFSCDGGDKKPFPDPATEMEEMRRAVGLLPSGQRPPAHHAFIAAIGPVAVCGRRLAMRVDGGEEGSVARVDVWEFGGTPRLVAEVALPPGGWNPIEMASTHVWVACREQLKRCRCARWPATTPAPAAAVTGDGEGGGVARLYEGGQLAHWDSSGRLHEPCSGDDPVLTGEREPIAALGSRVLVLLLDHPAGDEGGRRAAVVQLGRCRVLASSPFPKDSTLVRLADGFAWFGTAREPSVAGRCHRWIPWRSFAA